MPACASDCAIMLVQTCQHTCKCEKQTTHISLWNCCKGCRRPTQNWSWSSSDNRGMSQRILQGWYSLFPLSNEVTSANIVGWTALVGGTLFEAGAYAMVVEALNRGHTVRFGYEVSALLLDGGLEHLHLDRLLQDCGGLHMRSRAGFMRASSVDKHPLACRKFLLSSKHAAAHSL